MTVLFRLQKFPDLFYYKGLPLQVSQNKTGIKKIKILSTTSE